MGSESYTEAIHRLQSSSTVLPTKPIECSALSHSQNVFKGLPPFPVKKETHSPQDLEAADMDIVEESDLNTLLEDPPRKKGHRRSHSESVFYKTHNVGDEEQSDREEAACSDDLFALYIDMDKINNPVSDLPSRDRESWIKSLVDSSIGKSNTLPCETRSNKRPSHHARSVSVDGLVLTELHKEASTAVSPTMSSDSTTSRHFHSNSMDGSINFRIDLDGEVRKLNPNDKLAEIALVDPKRAKRILANRQSAARSKERKVRYISELERKVQTLQTEATSLSAQLTIFQRDSTGLTNENNELKLRLRGMEQEAQLRDALNDALREEIQMLKMKMVSTQPEYMQTGYFVKSEETNTSTPKF